MVNAGKNPMFTLEERVDLIKRVVADLPNVEAELWSGLLADFDKDIICHTVSGKPIKPKTLLYRYRKCLKQADLPEITFHDLRHINASLMAKLRIPDKYAQERGGWKTDHIMKSVYTETFSEERERVDGIIDGYFEKFV